MLTKYLIIAIIVTGLGGAFIFKLYINEAKKLAVSETHLATTQATLVKFEENFNTLNTRLDALNKQNQNVIIKDKETTRVLNNLKNREATVLAKRSLVALRINKSYQKRQNKIACLTGDFLLC
jgi:uncharacterized protein involved in exopolysaccharide biosynthesis